MGMMLQSPKERGTTGVAQRNDLSMMLEERMTGPELLDDLQTCGNCFAQLEQSGVELNCQSECVTSTKAAAPIGTFAAAVAHQLKQPLTAVRLSLENSVSCLEKDSCVGGVAERIRECLHELSYIAYLIEELQHGVRSSVVGESCTRVDLRTVCEKTAELFRDKVRIARVAIHLKDIDGLPAVYWNEKDLEQLVFTLMDNAIEAADGRKMRRIVISGRARDDHVELRFSDNCGGIAPENMGRIFEPFFTTKSGGRGTGLGLYLAQRIVSKAGGSIRVTSTPGKGSTFIVTLPITEVHRSRRVGNEE